ncbi:patatin-like phospholipase family protein [Paraburkholderia fungorum]|uniref:NTE family protein n=1 Tax=Paraburkholderia fungorum TaxID=134537 RepID=A0AAW3V5T7_9BURK|nr:patatin-like phospholipase family protein [Paraburkholderia fungorum]MBB4517488.1 NTE family protein [Paraburkholderia fungorum]MBB6204556.1 NTE family protein [Paraburkholderia fungorum]
MASRTRPKKIALALQGGGAHGAFTWGVLDRLLADNRLMIDAISGTSAGAMNAAVLADGFEKGGARGARDGLNRFWEAIARAGAFSLYRSAPWTPLGFHPVVFLPWYEWLAQMLSPYQLNPFNINPLRDFLTEAIDFDCVRACQKIRLYISATNVRTNCLRIFTAKELSVDVLMASACLPQIYQAIQIDGDDYWDGGYVGNPVLAPLIEECPDFADILIVQVNPVRRDDVPRTAAEIADRVNEVSFNSSLMRELDAIANITRLIEAGVVKDPRYQCVHLHRIAADPVFQGLGRNSKFDTRPAFLHHLRDLGREQADHWLDQHFDELGHASTLELPPCFERAT